MRSVDDIVGDLRLLRDRWWTFNGTEKSASQTFLNQLVAAYTALPDVFAAGATFEQFGSRAKGSGFMDLHWPELCIIEMKAPAETKRLARHRDQVLDYWRNSADAKAKVPAPRFLVLCSFHRFEVWEPGRFPNAPIDEFTIDELPDHYGSLLFLAGGEPVVGGPGQQLAAGAAEALADVYFSLLDRDAAEQDTLRRFILQVTWCLFAEDLGMLPGQPVDTLLRSLAKDTSRNSAVELGGFFYALSVPDEHERSNLAEGLPYVNGGLFEQPARVRLNPDELTRLIEAASYDWRGVNPTIFGGLMEACLGHDRRWELGAHYTYEQDIMSIVEPTIIRPWRLRIDVASTPTDADAVVAGITKFQVLDPACGCGNFLAIAYRELRHLLAQAVDRRNRVYAAAGATPPPNVVYYPLGNIHGIEIEPFAVAIARVTLWMTHKLVTDQYGLAEPVLPLIDLSNIVCADALEVDWPSADAIIGNPPYHGTKFIRGVLGDDYTNWLNAEFKVGVKDISAYWFAKADRSMRPGDRAGLVVTNSIREGKNRLVTLDRIVEHGGVITDAISTKKWPGEANVSVSIINWIHQPPDLPEGFMLDGRPVSGITTSLRPGQQRPDPVSLTANHGRQFYGIVPGGQFVIDDDRAHAILNTSGADHRAVVRRYVIGDDLAKAPDQQPRRWVINFGEMPLDEAMHYPAALDYVRAVVKPDRDNHKQAREREQWWKPSRSVQDTFGAISGLSRWIACPAQGKRFPMVWCELDWCPSNLVSVFAFDDDWSFGVLSSRPHQVWATEVSTKLELRPRYTTASFATFVFPPRLDAFVSRIESAAQTIVALRRTYCLEAGIGLTRLYNAVEEGAYADLATAHRSLDEAVCDSYGWSHDVLESTDKIVTRLLTLNGEVASGAISYEPF